MPGLFPSEWSEPIKWSEEKKKKEQAKRTQAFPTASNYDPNKPRYEKVKEVVPYYKPDIYPPLNDYIPMDKTPKAAPSLKPIPVPRVAVKQTSLKTSEQLDNGLKARDILQEERRLLSIPKEELCEEDYELPDFLKDPKYGIMVEDKTVVANETEATEPTIDDWSEEERTQFFFNALVTAAKDIKEQVEDIKKAGLCDGNGAAKQDILRFLQTFSNLGSIVIIEFHRTFGNESNDERINQLKKLIYDRESLTNSLIEKYQSINCKDTEVVCRGQELLNIFVSLGEYFSGVNDLFAKIMEDCGPKDVAEVLKNNRDISGFKYINTSSTKVLLIRIPEKLYLKSGYKSIEGLIKTMEQKGVVVAAVPASLNLYEIKGEDLAKLDLNRISKINGEIS